MSSKLPELTYFLDRSLGKHKIAEALRSAGRTVLVHDDVFDPTTPDEAWLPVAGESEWVVLTKDEHIRYRKNERAAVDRARVRLFVMTAGNLTGDEMAKIFVAALPRIEKLLVGANGPLIARIDRAGRVTALE